MSKVTHEWRDLGESLSVGDIKLLEGGKYIVCGVGNTAVPKRWFEVHCPGQGFMMLEFDGNHWYGCRLRVGPEWQVREGAFEGYLATLDLRDIHLSVTHKSMAEATPYGTLPYLLGGALLMAGALFSLLIREYEMAFPLSLLGGGSLALGLGLARMITQKYVRLTFENGVYEMLAPRFEKLLGVRLNELQREAIADIARAQDVQPVMEIRQWRMTSVVRAGG